jgi:hypothetical protein
MTRHSHAARFCLPLVLLFGGAAYGQLRPRPQSPPTNTTPVVTQPLSKMKHDVTIYLPMTSAPKEMKEKAFRLVMGRDPLLRNELDIVTRYVLKEVAYNCIPPSEIAEFDPPPKVKRTDWDCKGPIMDWLHDTPGGQAEYRAVYARAFKEVFGFDAQPWSLLNVKPRKDYITGQVGHHLLLSEFRTRLYGMPAPTYMSNLEWETLQALAKADKWQANTAAAVKDPRSLEATAERAFLKALNRKPTEADMKAVIPVFKQERATFSRMVYILQALDSLKNLKL